MTLFSGTPLPLSLSAAMIFVSSHGGHAFSVRWQGQRLGAVSSYASSTTALDMAEVGIFFGTSTGSTETVADLLAEELEASGQEFDGPFDVDTLEGSVKDIFSKYSALMVGTPTWNTGADTERSGTGWDELYYKTMADMDMTGTKVAVFGLGDQESYAENYADATGELHDVFQGLGCQMMGYTSQEGYEHEDSKSIRGDLFCGLLCDMVNQEELTEGRVKAWVSQLIGEGMMDGEGAGAEASLTVEPSSAAVIPESPVVIEKAEDDTLLKALEEESKLLDKTIQLHANTGFTPYYNPKSESTMWVSTDGRRCYYTAESPAKGSVSP